MQKFSRRSLLAGTAGAMAMPAAAAPQATSEGRLNVIHIGVDTWGTDWLGCYGAQQIRTPHVDALVSKSAQFLEMYPEVLPTIPCRRSVYTGRRIFPSDMVLQRDDQVKIRGWHQLYSEDATISETLQQAGYTTGIISDIYHQFKPDKNFHRGFDSWRWIRGQESDRLETGPRDAIRLEDYQHRSQRRQSGAAARTRIDGVLQYLLNRREWKTEDDWLPAQVFREAARWVENNARGNQPFYLHIESFSPHEFWDPPEDYYRMYMKSNYSGPRLIQPPPTTAALTPVEVEHVRALYGGLATFVDACIGKFLRRVESLGLMKNTIITFVADHGTMMGERGQFHKGEQRLRTQVTHVPLAIYHPQRQWEGRRIGGFVQHTDLMPTLLDLLGVKRPARATGESLAPLIEARRDSAREQTVTGWGEHGSVRTKEWNYIGRWSPGAAFEELYNVRRDPLELEDVAAQNPAVVKEFHQKLKQHVDGGWEVTRGTFAKVIS
jgi:arylsulfatase A-like enzyme